MDRCMTPRGHAAWAAFDFLEDHAPRAGPLLDLQMLPGMGRMAPRRKYIYKLLVGSAYRVARSDPDEATSVDRKLNRFVAGPRLGALFSAQACIVAGKLTPAV